MRIVLLTAILLATALAGCTDEPAGTPDPDPVTPGSGPSFNNTQPDTVVGLEFVSQLTYPNSTTPFRSGSGIWAYGDHVYGSALGAGFFIADISDPENPRLVYNATTDAADPSNNTITSFARDADVVAHPDGRMTLVLATQNDGMHVWDVTVPAAPVFGARVEVDPNHNIAVIPGTELVFNSQSGGLGRSNDLVDLSDPMRPVVVGTYGNHGCHDITFYGSLGDAKFRAYCAGIQRTEIWDMSQFNPDQPGFGIDVISTVEGEDSPVVGNPAFGAAPLRTLHHLAMVNEDATVLIIGDEHNGGGSPGTCFFNQQGLSTPFGALWFYDITDETDPQLLSWLSAPLVQPEPQPEADPNYDPLGDVPNCTAHFGTLIPGEEKLVMSWYSAGVLLIDFSDPSRPLILDQYQANPTNPWDARVHNGYVFTGDIVRGMDVLRLV